jgi:hypothetical protein
MLCGKCFHAVCAFLAIMGLACHAGHAGATVISPLNGSFEAPAVTEEYAAWGVWLKIATPDSWTQLEGTTVGYIHRPSGDIAQGQTPLFAAPTGTDNNQLYGLEYTTTIQKTGIYQDLGTMEAGKKYAFNAKLFSGSEGHDCGYRISFFDVTQNKELAYITQEHEKFNPFRLGGGLSTCDAAFDYSADASNAGDTLRLILSSAGNESSVYRMGIDNVTVTTSAVPEPASLVVLVSGAFGILAYAWRKRK